MSGGIIKESTMSEITKKRYEDNSKNQSERKRGILNNATEDEQRLYRAGLATIDYHFGKVVRL